MAPTKGTRAALKQTAINANVPTSRKVLTTRNSAQNLNTNTDAMITRGKRKAENSPLKNDKVKRSALGNLTNNVKEESKLPLAKKPENQQIEQLKTDAQHNSAPKSTILTRQTSQAGEIAATASSGNIKTRASCRGVLKVVQSFEEKTISSGNSRIKNNNNSQNHSIPESIKNEKNVPLLPPPAPMAAAAASVVLNKAQTKPMRRISNEFNKTEESLYMSALEDVSSCDSTRLSGNFEVAKRRSLLLQQEKAKAEKKEASIKAAGRNLKSVPEGVEDFDKANWNDPFQVSPYAMDIFNYLKEREKEFPITDYMEKQVHLSKFMRSLLVDWMVEVQETFELNHETLYLAVKIVDLFLCKVVINKDKLQLLGAAALFISCKYDERTPPLIDDFLYICDGAYQHAELTQMEVITLKTINHDLGIPLSYRFLRRYARCGKVLMPVLTLARYILELSLMDYATISYSDSQLACSALFMAMRMRGSAMPWSLTLEYYSGYKLVDFAYIVPVLNAGLHRKQKGAIKTIHSKYSHKIFHEVAKTPLMSTEQLFEKNLNVDTIMRLTKSPTVTT